MSETTSVPAAALNALLGSRIAPSSSERCAMYFRALAVRLSMVKLEVTTAMTPPGLTWSNALAMKYSWMGKFSRS